MPESKVRKAAADKKKQASREERAKQRAEAKSVAAPGSRAWVAPAFITVGLLGVLWLVVYYITFSVGIELPLMTQLGGWNVLVGMVLMAGSFALSTLWK